MTEISYSLPGSFFFVATGAVGSGKTYQAKQAVTATLDGEDLFGPCLYLLAEPSAEGTAAELFADPDMCVVVPAKDCDAALDALIAAFPSTGPATVAEMRAWVDKTYPGAVHQPPPTKAGGARRFRSIIDDTMTTQYLGQQQTESARAVAEADKKSKPKFNQATENNFRELARRATLRLVNLIDRLNGITQEHRGTLVIVSVHTQPRAEVIVDPQTRESKTIQCGEVPDLGRPLDIKAGLVSVSAAKNWDKLAAKANMIWHMYPDIPNMGQFAGDPSQINRAFADGRRTRYAAVTSRMLGVPQVGDVPWAKRQSGAGWMSIIGETMPALWHPEYCDFGQPDLGVVLTEAVRKYRSTR